MIEFNQKRFKDIKVYLALFLFLCSSCLLSSDQRYEQACFKKYCFDVEVAREPHELRQGLQLRESLGDRAGMLFIFPNAGIHRFWMKNTLIPLDMIWFNQKKEVIFIAPNVQPCQSDPCPLYGPGRQSSYVLEIKANRAASVGIRVGDQAVFYLKE